MPALPPYWWEPYYDDTPTEPLQAESGDTKVFVMLVRIAHGLRPVPFTIRCVNCGDSVEITTAHGRKV